MRRSAMLICLTVLSSTCFGNDMYRAPSPGDSGKYYVLNVEKDGKGMFRVLSSRIGKANAYTDFTRLKVNCLSRQYFELAGSSENGAKNSPTKPLKDWSQHSKWVSLVPGSSKSDLVGFVCRKYQ